MTQRWRRTAAWVLLCLYMLTGPVIEAVHFEPVCLSSWSGFGLTIHAPGDRYRGFPVDPSHTCVICTRLMERITTPAVPYHLAALRPVRLPAVRVSTGEALPVQYFSPDKRGPPSVRA